MFKKLFSSSKKRGVFIHKAPSPGKETDFYVPAPVYSTRLGESVSAPNTAPSSPCLEEHTLISREEQPLLTDLPSSAASATLCMNKRVCLLLQALHPTQEFDFSFYLQKLIRCSEEKDKDDFIVVVVFATELIERYLKTAPPANEMLLVISAVFRIAMKQIDEVPSAHTAKWASICGHSVKELCRVELLVCEALDWRVSMSLEQYEAQRLKTLQY
jgi:hypothetical protein